MQDLPHYNPVHLERLLRDYPIIVVAVAQRGNPDASFYVRAPPRFELVEDAPGGIDSVLHEFFRKGTGHSGGPGRRALNLVYGLPDREPLGFEGAAGSFYDDGFRPRHPAANGSGISPGLVRLLVQGGACALALNYAGELSKIVRIV